MSEPLMREVLVWGDEREAAPARNSAGRCMGFFRD